MGREGNREKENLVLADMGKICTVHSKFAN